MSSEPGSDQEPSIAERVRSLEESSAFAEHATEQITAEMLGIHRRLDAMARRLDTLERRLAEAALAEEQGPSDGSPTNEQLRMNKPPHSA